MKNQFAIKLDGQFTEAGAFDTGVEITAQGDSDCLCARPFASFHKQVARCAEKPLDHLGLAGDVTDIHLDSVEDTSKPFHLAYHYHKDNYFSVPTFRRQLPTSAPDELASRSSSRSEEGDEALGPAIEETYRARIRFPRTTQFRRRPRRGSLATTANT